MIEVHLCRNLDGTVYLRDLCRRCYMREWRATTTAPIKHGTASAYLNRNCRCDRCRESYTKYTRQRRTKP